MRICLTLSLFLILACSGQLSHFDRDSLEVLIDTGYDVRHPRWSADMSKLLIEANPDGNWDILLFDIGSKQMQNLSSDTAADRSPSWSPDNQSLVFQSNRNGQGDLYIYHFGDGSIQQLTNTVQVEMNPDWSPDGRYIAYAVTDSPAAQIEIIQVADRSVRRISHERFRSLWPRWSGDSRQLVFFSRRDTDNTDDELYIYDLNTGSTERITKLTGHDFTPSFSADYQLIISSSVRGDDQLLTLFNRRGQALDSLNLSYYKRMHSPDWSPRANQLVFTAQRDSDFYEIVKVKLN
ncbi:MAG: PD40 domain-containing protein [Calditrichaeota bacterium]|nr:PD40 domain-containing protein [Calditrichota bacterium]